jgi:nicotinic acid phosphoribosyltransferase
MKATYGEVKNGTCGYEDPKTLCHDMHDDGCNGHCKKIECREIFKAPITDSGEKKSKKGLLCVLGHDTNKGIGIHVIDQCTWKQEQKGLLTTIFKDGKLIKQTSLDEIRERLNKKLEK